MVAGELRWVVFAARGIRVPLHRSVPTLGTSVALSRRVAPVGAMPFADAPDPDPERSPVTVEAGRVQLLRLDRLVQILTSVGFGERFRFPLVPRGSCLALTTHVGWSADDLR